MKRSLVLFTVLSTAIAGCRGTRHRAPSKTARTAPTVPDRATPATSAASGAAPAPGAASAGRRAALAPIPSAEFAHLFRTLSGPDHGFFSDNYVSNETSYLQVAPALAKHAVAGRAYLGVGPEQNFTYIALTHPRLAFIVDIRRDNALLQLLYKSIFDRARSRTEFLSLLLGRHYDARNDPGPHASVEQVVGAVEKSAPDRALFERTHRELVSRIAHDYDIPLGASDRAALDKTQRAFFDGQLDLAFKLEPPNGRHYPTLRSLLEARDPAGHQLGFLASSAGFSSVRALERENRVIPVVGDFAGTRALRAVGRELSRRHLLVGAFYVSNVEQYVMAPAKWAAWISNVEALPIDNESLFIRCYLDQGRRHPLQMKGQRTTTVLERIRRFESRAGTYRSFFQVATDGLIKG